MVAAYFKILFHHSPERPKKITRNLCHYSSHLTGFVRLRLKSCRCFNLIGQSPYELLRDPHIWPCISDYNFWTQLSRCFSTLPWHGDSISCFMLSQFSYTDRGCGDVDVSESTICAFSQRRRITQALAIPDILRCKAWHKTVFHWSRNMTYATLRTKKCVHLLIICTSCSNIKQKVLIDLLVDWYSV